MQQKLIEASQPPPPSSRANPILPQLQIVQAPRGRKAASGVDCRGIACRCSAQAAANPRRQVEITNQSLIIMNTNEIAKKPVPQTAMEKLDDIIKRLGRVEKHLIDIRGERPR